MVSTAPALFGRYIELNEIGRRAGCPWIDIEAARMGPELKAFANTCKKQHVRLIGSNHVLGPMPSTSELGKLLKRTELNGLADVAKFVGWATKPEEALHVHAAAAAANLKIPHIALAMSQAGQMSRVLNSLYTPVTHELLPFVAAPGQVSTLPSPTFSPA